LIFGQSPQDVQELVHQNAQGLHLGERVFGPPLEIGVEASEVRLASDQAHTRKIQQSLQFVSIPSHGKAGRIEIRLALPAAFYVESDIKQKQRSHPSGGESVS
jgi:hypothetical protein